MVEVDYDTAAAVDGVAPLPEASMETDLVGHSDSRKVHIDQHKEAVESVAVHSSHLTMCLVAAAVVEVA